MQQQHFLGNFYSDTPFLNYFSQLLKPTLIYIRTV